ncbi:MAG: hypothetical protein HYT76_06485 [Deltaproteobacteria bacterium]|nr:hypothetical protein [Deltaproteobacteria bacterium]
MKYRRILLALFFFVPSTSQGFSLYEKNNVSLKLSGYFKNLVFNSKRMVTNNAYIADLNRLRLEGEATFFEKLSAKVAWDNELILGDYVQTEEFNSRQTVRNSPYLDMDYEISRRENFFYGQAFYRAHLKYDAGPFVLTVGRQKIDWGSARLLSPADLFTPISIFDVEKEEKTGSDAVNLVVPLGEKNRANLIYTADRDLDRSRTGLRWTSTVEHFDISLYGGRFQRDGIFGIDYSGDVGQSGLRGELNYNFANQADNFLQASLGLDHGFENSLYLLGEYFFNGQALNQRNPNLFLTTRSAQPIKTQYQHFFNTQAKYDLTPLWIVQLMNIWDLSGSSLFINPETVYELFSWLNLTGGALLPVGRTAGEFGAIPNFYYLQAQLFF